MSLLIVKVLPGILLTSTEITENKYFSPLRPSRELKKYVKVSKILYHWFLLLNPFCFVEIYYLHITTRVFDQSAISPFLGGKSRHR